MARCAALLLAALPAQAHDVANSCVAHSAAARVGVIELYTSEGCSSCPPADRWVSALPGKGFGDGQVVALAFHVDYWDELGWRDRMGKAQFSARQREQAHRSGARVIYTPQFLLNGTDYRPGANFADQLAALNRRPPAADIGISQSVEDSMVKLDVEARITNPVAGGAARAYVAITENGLETAIQAGENQGRKLHHDFVVREISAPRTLDPSGAVHWRQDVPLRAEWKRQDLAIVVFVEDARTGDILQALRTPLCSTR